MTRPTLGTMTTSGVRALSRYTGTLLAVHAVMLIVTSALVLAVAAILAQAFAHLPYWDDAVDGDLVALVACVRHGKSAFGAIAGLMFGALVLWQLTSWFLAGGLYGVLVQRPEGRREVARVFGACGASTYLAYARLALLQLPAYALVLFVLGVCAGWAAPTIEHALTLPELFGGLGLMFGPALVLLHGVWTVTDYVRVELALRQDSHDPGVFVTYLRTLAFVAKHPLTLVHGAIGWLAWISVTLAYAYVAAGHPMYGAGGAIAIFVVRQGVALVRTAIRFAIMSGQIELGRARPQPGPSRRASDAAERVA